MTTLRDPHPPLHVPARDIPVPASVSPQARAMLAQGTVGPAPDWPAADDLQGWRELVAAMDAGLAVVVTAGAAGAVAAGTVVEDLRVGEVPVYAVTPQGVDRGDRRVYLDIHGGSWTLCGGEICRAIAVVTPPAIGAPLWAVDYRMPPDHPYPAPLDDCLDVYRVLLDDHCPEDIVVGGTSAGGSLAAALMLRVRDEGLPLPAAVVLSTPVTDLTEAGDTWQTNMGIDTVLVDSLQPAVRLYAGGHDVRDPYLSPLFGDFTKGFPPTILLSGTRDCLLSDTVRLHRALRADGIPAELHVFEAAGHGGFHGTAPEDQDRAGEIRRFVDAHWGRNSR
jgi:monoterpene epsilon-lactone hydrolase